jgi:UDP-GlcNAc:undecaprenyl-phosphate GlcNAc-1-phosphate transferase
MNLNYTLFFIFIFTTIISIGITYTTIKISVIKKLYDSPNDDRKIHLYNTPNLGGVAIFFSFILVSSLQNFNYQFYNYYVASALIIFFLGIKDDIVGLDPSKKFLGQIISSLILTYFTDIRIHNLNGLFGLYEISIPLSILITIIFIVFILNAYNLIDGINGLAGCLSILALISFMFVFLKIGNIYLLKTSVILIGSIFGFLYFNFNKAKIFMGDTGSLFIGLILSILTITLINNSQTHEIYKSKYSLVISFLIIPIFDTLRVFVLRIMNGKSPFNADKNHIHHRLLKMGFSHLQIVLILCFVNIIIIILNFYLQFIGDTQLFIFNVSLSVLFNIFLFTISNNRKFTSKVKIFNFKENSKYNSN